MGDWIENLPSAWIGHRKFAEWLVTYKRPETIVELGVDYGYSTFCFANALNKNNKGKIYGVDLFQGDKHTSFRNTYEFVVNQMKAHHLNRIELVVKDFTEASQNWKLPIDILHIDGMHTYESVKNDFTNWSRYVKDDGIILLHDVCIYDGDFGVYKFFEELDWHKLYFEHSAGLGIISKNVRLLKVILETFPECKVGQQPEKLITKSINKKNLFLIISVLYPSDAPLSYVSHRTLYNSSERFSQTKKTIESIREKAPGSYIYLCEGSELPLNIENQLRSLVDRYENFSGDPEVKKYVDSPQKGAGEVILILNAIKKINDIEEFENYFKISGRYYLDDHFDLNHMMTNSNIFSLCEDRLATTLYKIHKSHMKTYIDALNKCLLNIEEGLEIALFKQFPPGNSSTSMTDRIGVSGLIAVYNNYLISN